MKRLSMIIPMYNVEPFVDRCIRSLENQDIPPEEFEIICVNDGSPDKSREVVLRLQQEYQNLILIDQENQGVSRARNNGIERAEGQYLLFIDPDDYVDPLSFSRILGKAESEKAEVSFLGFTFLREDGTAFRKSYYEDLSSRVFVGLEAYYKVRGPKNVDPDRMCAILIEMDFLNRNKLRYLSGIPYLEDGELIARILCLANRCIFDGHSFYQRTTRPGSATNSSLFYSDRAGQGFLRGAINLREFQHREQLSEEQIQFLNQPISKFVMLAADYALQRPYLRNHRYIQNNLASNNLGKLELSGVKRPYRLYVKLYNHSLLLYLMYACLKRFRTIIQNRFKRIK